MANHHFGKFADVWKHLVLLEVLASERPARYAETHAGSAANPMVDDTERRFGIRRFLDVAGSEPRLASSRYRARIAEFGDAATVYPGSALLAMAELRDNASYLLCDLDPVSAQDLRQWPGRLGVGRWEVAEADGMATVSARLDRDPGRAVVHIDPFDPRARGTDNGPSALDLAARVANSGHGLVYWYGYSAPDETAWAYREIGEHTTAALWCGDLLVTDEHGEGRRGDLGLATTPGTGSGVVLANVSNDTRLRCEELGRALARAYDNAPLPDGNRGGLAFTVLNG